MHRKDHRALRESGAGSFNANQPNFKGEGRAISGWRIRSRRSRRRADNTATASERILRIAHLKYFRRL